MKARLFNSSPYNYCVSSQIYKRTAKALKIGVSSHGLCMICSIHVLRPAAKKKSKIKKYNTYIIVAKQARASSKKMMSFLPVCLFVCRSWYCKFAVATILTAVAN